MNETIKGMTDTLESGFDKIAEAYDIPEADIPEAKLALGDELEYLVKEAGFFGSASTSAGKALGGSMGGFGTLLGTAAVGTAGVLTANAISGLASLAVKKIGKTFGASANRASYDASFRRAMEMSEVLQNDPQKAKRMADTIFGFAPNVASDPNVLVNILVNSIHGDSMDLQTVRAVTELEEKLHKMKVAK